MAKYMILYMYKVILVDLYMNSLVSFLYIAIFKLQNMTAKLNYSKAQPMIFHGHFNTNIDLYQFPLLLYGPRGC